MYNISVTTIIIRDHKVLLTKRCLTKKRWPNKWTVPGGGLEDLDFIGTPTEVNNQWYWTLENCARREVREEVGLEIGELEYLTNIAIPGGLIFSFLADWDFGEVKLQKDECSEYKWATLSEAYNMDLIDGLYSELDMCGDLHR